MTQLKSKIQPKSKDVEKREYPIGRNELAFYLAVCVIHCLLACVLAVRASRSVGSWFNSVLRASNYVSGYFVDDSDAEWMLFREAIRKTVIGYSIHSVIFNLSNKIRDRRQRSAFLVVFWLALTVWLTTLTCVRNCIILATFVTLFTIAFKQELIAWILCVLFVCNCSSSYIAYDLNQPQTYYREYQLYIYLAVKVLNFNIHLCRNPDKKLNLDLGLQFFEYMFYPPYSSLLIVLFEDYCAQREQIGQQSAKSLTWMAFRLAFWFYFVELSLHFTRVNAFFNAPFTVISNLNNYELFSIAYIRGQFFHTKYVVIFGVPRLFAHVDGMSPPGPAICISRITKYSRMWRFFDRGLYAFLKTQLYVPLLKACPNVYIGRFVAMLIVFGFVLLWHGVNFNFFAWVSLSAVELIVERIGFMFYKSEAGTKLRQRLGDSNFLRITAIALLSNVIPGIFGAFFFLDKRDVALTIFSKVLVDGVKEILQLNLIYPSAGFVFLHLLLLGYCYNHICCYLHFKLDEKVKKE